MCFRGASKMSTLRAKLFVVILACTVIAVLTYFGHPKFTQRLIGYTTMTVAPKSIDQQINETMTLLSRTLPQVDKIDFNKTSSALNSTSAILNYKPKYCVGDTIIVRVEMYNHLRERKTYGGDFLRARIFSPQLSAGASGRIVDFNNGSYNIYFTLFWEGEVQISIILMHPSEGTAVLWKKRNAGHKYILFTGKFLNNSKQVHTECGFDLDSQKEKCKYAGAVYGEPFYCIKLPGVPCETFISMRSNDTPNTYLSDNEKALFARSNVGEEIPKLVQRIDVLKYSTSTVNVTRKCQTGIIPPFPGGYFLRNQWFSIHCNLSSFEPLSHIQTCLAGKIIYLMGDSTLRQWIKFFPKVLPDLKFYENHESGWHKVHMAFDLKNNIYVQWKKHGHPFLTLNFYNEKVQSYITDEIAHLAGGSNTVVVFSVGLHFRPLPLQLFIRRLLDIRDAIENLFLRSPDTKVIIKSENTREMKIDFERYSDFHGYMQYQAVKEIFRGLNVGMIDAWDMTVASASYSLHPAEFNVRNQINIFLSYIC